MGQVLWKKATECWPGRSPWLTVPGGWETAGEMSQLLPFFCLSPGQLLLTSVVGRCELAVAVPVGTGHWQVAVPCLESRAAAGAAGRFLHTLVL